MNFKELVDVVSSETKLPAAQVRKVSISMLMKFAELIEQEGKFTSPVIAFHTTTAPARPEEGDKPARPERRFARMMIKSKKSAVAA